MMDTTSFKLFKETSTASSDELSDTTGSFSPDSLFEIQQTPWKDDSWAPLWNPKPATKKAHLMQISNTSQTFVPSLISQKGSQESTPFQTHELNDAHSKTDEMSPLQSNSSIKTTTDSDSDISRTSNSRKIAVIKPLNTLTSLDQRQLTGFKSFAKDIQYIEYSSPLDETCKKKKSNRFLSTRELCSVPSKITEKLNASLENSDLSIRDVVFRKSSTNQKVLGKLSSGQTTSQVLKPVDKLKNNEKIVVQSSLKSNKDSGMTEIEIYLPKLTTSVNGHPQFGSPIAVLKKRSIPMQSLSTQGKVREPLSKETLSNTLATSKKKVQPSITKARPTFLPGQNTSLVGKNKGIGERISINKSYSPPKNDVYGLPSKPQYPLKSTKGLLTKSVGKDVKKPSSQINCNPNQCIYNKKTQHVSFIPMSKRSQGATLLSKQAEHHTEVLAPQKVQNSPSRSIKSIQYVSDKENGVSNLSSQRRLNKTSLSKVVPPKNTIVVQNQRKALRLSANSKSSCVVTKEPRNLLNSCKKMNTTSRKESVGHDEAKVLQVDFYKGRGEKEIHGCPSKTSQITIGEHKQSTRSSSYKSSKEDQAKKTATSEQNQHQNITNCELVETRVKMPLNVGFKRNKTNSLSTRSQKPVTLKTYKQMYLNRVESTIQNGGKSTRSLSPHPATSNKDLPDDAKEGFGDWIQGMQKDSNNCQTNTGPKFLRTRNLNKARYPISQAETQIAPVSSKKKRVTFDLPKNNETLISSKHIGVKPLCGKLP